MRKFYPEPILQNIADAIRSENGLSDKYMISEMAPAINEISYNDNISIFAERKQSIYEDTSFPYIRNWMFAYYDALYSVSFPEASRIQSMAFYSCYNLVNAYTPNVTGISSYAFAYCYVLNSISYPNIQNISGFAFDHCISLTDINISTVASTCYLSNVFNDCHALKSIYIPNIISLQATFINCYELESVYTPNLSRITNRTFYNCYKLSRIFDENITYIGENYMSSNAPFYNCGIVEISLPKFASRLSGAHFTGCSSLSMINAPLATDVDICFVRGLSDALMYLSAPAASWAFRAAGCHVLSNYQELNSVTSLKRSAFYDCYVLPGVSMPNVTTIDEHAFLNCNTITELSFPKVSEIYGRIFCTYTDSTPHWDMSSYYDPPSVLYRPDYNYLRLSTDCRNLSKIYIGEFCYSFPLQEYGLSHYQTKGYIHGFLVMDVPENSSIIGILNGEIQGEHYWDSEHELWLVDMIIPINTWLAALYDEDFSPEGKQYVQDLLFFVGPSPVYDWYPTSDGKIYVPASLYSSYYTLFNNLASCYLESI